jgi:AraC-like DNA-binding protein
MALFQEQKPINKLLIPYVDRYIQMSGMDIPSKYVPPHSSISLVMDFSHQSWYKDVRFKTAVIGHQEQAFYLHRPPDTVSDVLHIRFTACGFSPFVHLSLDEINNTVVDATDLFGTDIHQLYDALQSTSQLFARIQLFENFLLQRFRPTSSAGTIISNIADTLRGQINLPRLEILKINADISSRQVERMFRSMVGINMRQYRRLVRWEKARTLLEQNQYQKLSDVAYEAGYFDQSHFIADFRAMMNISPKEYKPCALSH